MQLKSKNVTAILKNTIIIAGISSCLSLILIVYKKFMPTDSANFLWIYDINLVFMGLLTIFEIVYYLIWLYIFHSDITRLYPDYPITKYTALGRVMIPYYNLWGFWNIYSTYAKLLKSEYENTFKNGYTIAILLPFFYPLIIISKILSRVIYREGFMAALSDTSFFKLELIHILLCITVYIIWFSMQKIMYESLVMLSKNKPEK